MVKRLPDILETILQLPLSTKSLIVDLLTFRLNDQNLRTALQAEERITQSWAAVDNALRRRKHLRFVLRIRDNATCQEWDTSYKLIQDSLPRLYKASILKLGGSYIDDDDDGAYLVHVGDHIILNTSLRRMNSVCYAFIALPICFLLQSPYLWRCPYSGVKPVHRGFGLSAV